MYPNPDPCGEFYLECVTVCVNYGDFLAQTLPWNLDFFDHMVVVTTPGDRETREVCRKYGVKCLISKECYRNGDTFNKGRLINIGLEHLSWRGWVLHLDADMALPGRTRHLLKHAHLDPNALYGCDRVMLKSFRDWQRWKHANTLHHDYHCRVNFPFEYSAGTRWVNEQYGYCPIGAFQLWNTASAFDSSHPGINIRPYPITHQDAARGDIQFALQWDTRDRRLLPSVIAAHLESEHAKLGANWKGRATKRFS